MACIIAPLSDYVRSLSVLVILDRLCYECYTYLYNTEDKTILLHLQSDIHIEMGPWIGQSVSSDVTVCAGDIGVLRNLPRLKAYFDDIKKTTDHVIWVLGNHEYYNFDIGVGLQEAHEFAKKEGIHLMDEALGTDNLVIDGVTFWGSTLWTDINAGDWGAMNILGRGMNDFHIITDNDGDLTRPFTAQKSMEINKRTRQKINWDADVIITHHHPLLREHSRFPMSDITYGFCNTGLEQQIIDCDVQYWISGHTHDSTYENLNGTKCLSNQQGYCKKSWQTGDYTYEQTGFDPGLILEI